MLGGALTIAVEEEEGPEAEGLEEGCSAWARESLTI